MKKLLSIIACLLVSVTMMMAQKTVTGRVISGDDGEPIIGASVVVTGTTTGTVTDLDGNFSVKAPESAKTLTVTYVGMESQTVTITNKSLLITLSSNNEVLDEVMVVAFGTEKRSAFTGSAKVVGADELAKSQVTSVTAALAGAVPGLTLTSSNGAPGSSPTIRVRGMGSLNASNDPLIIVDGAPYSGDISNINPNDVESMTVLKDAASNALYGARGAGGVIMITTKQAKKGSNARVSFDAKWGVNSKAIKQYDVISDPAQYYEMQYKALNNYYKTPAGGGMDANAAWIKANQTLLGNVADGGLGYNIWTYPEGQMLIGANGRLNPNATLGRVVTYKGEEYLITPDDWEDIGIREGARQEYNFSVSAANDKSTFYMSLGYLTNEGITYRSDMERLTGRLRGDYQAKEWLRVGASMSYTRFESNSMRDNGSSSSTGNVFAFTQQMAPIYPAYFRNPDGTIKKDAVGNDIMDYGDGLNGGMSRPFIYNANPIQDNKLNRINSEGNAATANVFADIKILPGLVITLNGTMNLNETRYKYLYNPYYGQFASEKGLIEVGHSRYYNYNLQQLINYTATFADKHNLNVMAGHEYYNVTNTDLYAEKNNMFSQTNLELNGAVVDKASSGSSRSFYNNEGYMSRVQYNFDEKYFLSASYRMDASSRFHPDHRWGSFWSVGGAWQIHKEDFFNVDWVNELKFKASYGKQGNDGISNYLYTDRYNIVNSSGSIGVSFAGKGTEDITWEKQGNFNTGFEFSLFNNKLSGGIEYYYRKTTDMLYSFGVAPSLGYSSYYDNVGDMHNTGVELDLQANIIRQKNLNWDFHFNISTLKNSIDMIHEDNKTGYFYDKDGNIYEGFIDGSYFYYEGASMYSWRLKEAAGLDEDGQQMWWKNVYKQDADGKDILDDKTGQKIVDHREKTAKYADADYYVNKKSGISPVFGGFGTTISAYGFDLSINCSYSLGGKRYDNTYATFMTNPTSSHGGYLFHKDILNAWSEDNINSTIPRFVYGDTYNASSSDRFLTDASYLNIENINLGYTVPQKLSRKALLENVRIYLACENVAYWSKRQGFDPRQNYGGGNATNYSPMRTISGGVSLTF